MLVVRFKVTCHSDRADEIADAMRAVVGPSRALAGVIHFDVARDLVDPHCVIATEVFESRDAMDAQESQPEVAKVVSLIEGGALAARPEWTIYEVASAETPQM
ncbi:MAG: putative quinol monooxygenase [Microthrixaceae bacterium]